MQKLRNSYLPLFFGTLLGNQLLSSGCDPSLNDQITGVKNVKVCATVLNCTSMGSLGNIRFQGTANGQTLTLDRAGYWNLNEGEPANKAYDITQALQGGDGTNASQACATLDLNAGTPEATVYFQARSFNQASVALSYQPVSNGQGLTTLDGKTPLAFYSSYWVHDDNHYYSYSDQCAIYQDQSGKQYSIMNSKIGLFAQLSG